MAVLQRDPEGASSCSFDLIVLGGGIYGAMVQLEAARRGIRSLLLERGDFGGATSANHFRIVHGGLRYLQSLDLPRFREAVAERRWWLRTFPDLVEPLRCVMPLYGEGLRRAAVMKIALRANDLLSASRNQGVRDDRRLERAHILDRNAVLQEHPFLRSEGLEGAAVWYDARMRHSSRLVIETLRWAADFGAVASNYVEAVRILEHDGVVTGVEAVDHVSQRRLKFRGHAVVNAMGPWVRTLGIADQDPKHSLFRKSRAWNVTLSRKPLAPHALAVKPPEPNGRTYFLHSRNGRLFAGTGHAACAVDEPNATPSEENLASFLDDLNRAIPGLDAGIDGIDRVFSGFLPAKSGADVVLQDRPVIRDHARLGGPTGLLSVSGVKFTTARAVAAKVVERIGEKILLRRNDQFDFDYTPRSLEPRYLLDAANSWEKDCAAIIREESVVHLEDLVFRRTDLGEDLEANRERILKAASMFTWSISHKQAEVQRVLGAHARTPESSDAVA